MYEEAIIIRKPTRNDIDQLAELIYRFYALNEEFDSSWAIRPDAREVARKAAESYVEESEGGKYLIFIAEYAGSIVGYIKSQREENEMLASNAVEIIKELYVRPRMRRTGIASQMISKVSEEASKRGAKHIAVEFPTQNYVAEDLYKKLGFRPYSTRYIKGV